MSIVPWTPRTSAGGVYVAVGAAWSPTLNRFISVGAFDFAEYSSDGITWSISQVSPVFPSPPLIWYQIYDAVWASTLGLFVISGQLIDTVSGGVWTSPDGITWTERTIPNNLVNKFLFVISWSEELGVLAIPVYNTSVVLTSTDGINWVERTVTGSELILGTFNLTWSKARGTFLGVTAYDSILTSTDGINWVTTLITPMGGGTSICYSEALDMYVVNGPTTISSSSDGGTTWVERVPSIGYSFSRAIYVSRPEIADIGLFMVSG